MAWWLPLGITGIAWLANKIWGQKPEPPQESAWMYRPQFDINAWKRSAQGAVRGEVSDWLRNAMLGYRRQASGRGWSPTTSSGYTEFGDIASEKAAQALAKSLADIENQAAQMQLSAWNTGAGRYSQAYQNWLQNAQQGQANWIAGLMGLLGNIDWSKVKL